MLNANNLVRLFDENEEAAFYCDKAFTLTRCNRRFIEMFNLPDTLNTPEGIAIKLNNYDFKQANSRLVNDLPYFSSNLDLFRQQISPGVIYPVEGNEYLAVVLQNDSRAISISPDNSIEFDIINMCRIAASEISGSQKHFSILLEEVYELIDETKVKTMLSLLDGTRFACFRLQRLFYEYTDYYKLSRENASIELKTTDLNSWFAQLKTSLDNIFLRSKYVFNYEITQEQIIAPINHDLLSSAIFHLISNACRFCGEDNEVTVSLSNASDGYTIIVSDNGMGIAKAELDKAFTPFLRLTDETPAERYGIGLGLPIAKRVAELHGGSLMITSSTGGTSVAIRLPIADSGNIIMSSTEKEYVTDKFAKSFIYLGELGGRAK